MLATQLSTAHNGGGKKSVKPPDSEAHFFAHSLLIFITVAFLFLSSVSRVAYAAVDWTDEVDPNDPTTWNAQTFARVGITTSGTLSLTDSSSVVAKTIHVGAESGSTGAITVDSSASLSTINDPHQYPSGGLSIGTLGSGTLDIKGGGKVDDYMANVGGSLGTFSEATVNGDGSEWTSAHRIFVGTYGTGKLSITGGGVVRSAIEGTTANSDNWNRIGYWTDSTGEVTVNGQGSAWNSNGVLCVGNKGYGTLSIEDGGSVSNAFCYIGTGADSIGVVAVKGANSVWTNNGSLSVGDSGKGTLHMTGGGAATATSVSVNSQSLVAIDVDNGSQLTIGGGTGTITNDGTVRILAGAGAAATTYTPISATTFTNNSAWQDIGGKWDTNHFIVSTAIDGSSGVKIKDIHLDSTQRVLTVDGHGWAVGTSFLEQSNTTDFTATAISDTTLQGRLPTGQSVLSGWEFLADNYTVSETNPVYLSLKVGSGRSLDDLELWHYTLTGGWQPYTAWDLTYDGTYASFTATSFSGYAISTVPEPSVLVLLGIGAVSLLGYAWRRRSRTM